MDIKRLAQTIVQRFRCRDPFSIAEALGFTIIHTPLVGVRGFYQCIKRCHIIYLDTSLDEHEARFVCAHELGHFFLHRGYNRIFMDTRTFMATSKYEVEANKFAADLIYDDYDLLEFLDFPIATAAVALGLPERIATYRLESVQPVMLPTRQ